MNIPLPEMEEAAFDAAGLAALAREVDAHAQELVVSTKGGAEVRSDEPGALTAAQSADRIIAGQVQALQWRYVFQDVRFADTVLRSPAGFKLLRMQLP